MQTVWIGKQHNGVISLWRHRISKNINCKKLKKSIKNPQNPTDNRACSLLTQLKSYYPVLVLHMSLWIWFCFLKFVISEYCALLKIRCLFWERSVHIVHWSILGEWFSDAGEGRKSLRQKYQYCRKNIVILMPRQFLFPPLPADELFFVHTKMIPVYTFWYSFT